MVLHREWCDATTLQHYPSPGSLRLLRRPDLLLATLTRASRLHRDWERVLRSPHHHRWLERNRRLAPAVFPHPAGVLPPQRSGQIVWPEVVLAQVHLARGAATEEVAHAQTALHADAV